MATPLLQKVRQRKMFYFSAIVVLFTLSLVHREFYVKPQAARLQLTETGRGEVELTSSAVRLMLTGSRGLAVTFLWHSAIEKQKRNEWNELELIVKSVTKLQPYFITPWLYQSWNLSFNVAVESDRPHDKYYYISRGLDLLAEGERFNSGSGGKPAAADPDRIVIPGNPELRHFMGFIYQLKIGNSDEHKTMRSLLELSCIDPIERRPERFLLSDKRHEVNLTELAKFAQKYPRLVRRLHDQLAYTDPARIVQFLQDHENIPNRFEPVDKAKQALITKSKRKDPMRRFPILTPPKGKWENPDEDDLIDQTNESIDVFLVCRAWYEFAQEPLPPPDDNPGLVPPDYDKLKYRVPKGMVTQLFRSYPARAQVFIAETLESEGFFDADGWDMSRIFETWAQRRDVAKSDRVFGTEPKYHSRLAWLRGQQAYKEYGLKNGMYISPGDLRDLHALAALFRKTHKPKPDMMPEIKPDMRQGKMGESVAAHMKLHYNQFYRNLCNFDAFYYQAEGESDPITTTLRKTLFFAERKRKRETPSEQTLRLYDQAWSMYTHACFKYPRFAQVSSMQQDLYDIHQKSLGVAHQVHRDKFRNPVVLAAKIGLWPTPNWQEAAIQFVVVSGKENDPQEMNNVFPMRNRYGLLDRIQYYDGPEAKDLKEMFLYSWIQGAGLMHNMSVPQAVAFPNGHEYYLLTRTTPYRDDNLPKDWQNLLDKDTRALLSARLGLKIVETPK